MARLIPKHYISQTVVTTNSKETNNTIIYVKDSATGNNDGSSWGNAYTQLEKAIEKAQSGDSIWVAKGTYKPTTTKKRTATFQLINGVKIYGGFAGNEKNRKERDWEKNKTILSGDIGKENDKTDNSYHVVNTSNTDSSALLDGFMITLGNANDNSIFSAEGQGGGIYNKLGNPTFYNLTIANNYARYGGGMYNQDGQPNLSNIDFISNTAANAGGGFYNDGGIYDEQLSPSITNVNFISNTAENYEGGGLYNKNTSPNLVNVIFKENTALSRGGGIYNLQSQPKIINGLFDGNISGSGGGIYNDFSSATVTNSTFANNISNFGAAFYSENQGDVATIIRNSILWDNQATIEGEQIYNDQIAIQVTNSLIEGGYQGKNNFDSNPLFVNPDNFDWRLSKNSPALNQGDNNFVSTKKDLAENNRIVDKIVDLGAYEGAGLLPQPTLPQLGNQIIYVNINAEGENDGNSWDNAYTNLQQAIESAPIGSQIWVAAGTYTPFEDSRYNSFQLKNSLEIYGGFASGEKKLSQRNWEKNQTILSGNIGNKKNDIDNSYSVVNASNTNSSALLDGFTITEGYAGESRFSQQGRGGGIYSELGNARLANLMIINNYAQYGGGMSNNQGQPNLNNVIFANNTASNRGGGLYNEDSTVPILNNISFFNNTANDEGGGLYNNNSNPILIDSIFRGNTANFKGGGLYNLQSSPKIINAVFDGNSSENGGGIYNNFTSLSIVNSTFSNNVSNLGGAIYNENINERAEIINSILWGNKATLEDSQIYNKDNPIKVNYSLVEGGYSGFNNIQENPLFIKANSGNLSLQPDSPVINKGDNQSIFVSEDLAKNNRIINEVVDLGAYEYTPSIKIDFKGNPKIKVINPYGDNLDGQNTLINNSANYSKCLIKGNGWNKVNLKYQFTSNTVLKFQFRSKEEGEIQGIGFDTNNQINQEDGKLFFQLYGTGFFGINQFQYNQLGQWQTFTIPVGQFFDEQTKYLTFANQNYVSKSAKSEFRKIKIYENLEKETNDILTGTPNSDIFSLSNSQNYNVIEGFNPSQDVIQLSGKKEDYFLASSPDGLPSGTGVFFKTSNEDQLLGIITTVTNLNLDNNYFLFQ